MITLASPVQQGGRLIGVSGVDTDLQTISNLINALDFDGSGHAFIVNGEGKILIHPKESWRSRASPISTRPTPRASAAA